MGEDRSRLIHADQLTASGPAGARDGIERVWPGFDREHGVPKLDFRSMDVVENCHEPHFMAVVNR